MSDQPLIVVVDGLAINTGMQPADPLVRAVVISLFTWRRAQPGDDLPGSELNGWWGDTHADQAGDQIGSRLWLLSRSSLNAETVARAKDYATEALQWLLDDGVASKVEVTASRVGMDRLLIAAVILRADGQTIDLRFENAWEFLNAL